MSAIQKRLSNMEIRFDESEVIVVDLGSGFIKAGYSGEDVPRVVIPTVVGEPENVQAEDSGNPTGDSKPSKFIQKKMGMDAFLNRHDHGLHFPIQRGIIQDWDRLTMLLEHVFTNELGIEPRNATVLMTDSLKSKKEDKQHLA